MNITEYIETNKETVILGALALLYVVVLAVIMGRTITGSTAAASGATNTILYSIMLFFPVAAYYYRYGAPQQLDISSAGNIVKSAIYIIAFIGLVYGAIFLIGNFSFVLAYSSFLIGALIVVVFLAFVYEGTAGAVRRLDPQNQNVIINWVKFLWKVVFYVPCLFIEFLRYIENQLEITTPMVWTLFVIEIALILLYYYLPDIIQTITTHDGKLLVNRPVYLNKKQILGAVSEIFPRADPTVSGRGAGGTYNPFIQKEAPPPDAMSGSGTATDRFDNVVDVSCSAVYLNSAAGGYIDVSGCDLDKYDPTYDPTITEPERDDGAPLTGARVSKYVRSYSVAMWVFINPQPSAVGLYSIPTNIFRIGKENYENLAERQMGKPQLTYFNKTAASDGQYEPTYRIFLSTKQNDYQDVVLPDQRWNLFVFNYTDRGVSVFVNGGEMVAARQFSQPLEFYDTDYFVVGEDGGLDGSVSSLTFFPHILTVQQIKNYYSSTRATSWLSGAPVARVEI